MKYQYLYLTIKRESVDDPYAAIVLNEINRYAHMNADKTFERHELTVLALEHIIDSLDKQHNITGRIQSPSMVRAYINKYLGKTGVAYDIPGLKLK